MHAGGYVDPDGAPGTFQTSRLEVRETAMILKSVPCARRVAKIERISMSEALHW